MFTPSEDVNMQTLLQRQTTTMRRLPVGPRLYCTPGAVLDKNLTLRYLVLKHFVYRVLLVLSSGQRIRRLRVRHNRQRRRRGWQRERRRAGERWQCRGRRGSAQCGRGWRCARTGGWRKPGRSAGWCGCGSRAQGAGGRSGGDVLELGGGVSLGDLLV